MKRAGSPEGGRKKTAAKGTAKKPVKNAKPAKGKTAAKSPAKAPGKSASKTVSAALKKATGVARKLAGKIAKSVGKSVTKTVTRTMKKAAAKSSAKTAGKSAPAKKTPKPSKASASKAKAAAKTDKTAKAVKPAKTAVAKAPVAAPKPRARALRPKAFAELETARGFGFPEATPELPDAYGEDRLVLMTKDPEYLFAYWEVTPERFAQGERAKHGGEEYREALRLNWTSRDLLEDSFALLPVSLDAKRWYLRVPFSGLSYHVEIGWLSEQGHFISLLGSSNASDAPESWAKTRERLRETEGAAMEYSLRSAQPLGSSESRPVAAAKRPAAKRKYEGPGSQSSSDAAVKIPAARAHAGKRS